MFLSSNQTAILYIDKNALYFCSRSYPSVLKLVFAPDTVKDFDIINQLKLENEINTFIKNNKIAPIPAIIVLAKNVLFEKEFPKSATPPGTKFDKDMQDKMLDDQIQIFIDNIPFDKVSVKKYNSVNSTKIIATNETLYSIIKDVFKKSGFIIDVVAPISILDQYVNIAGELNIQTCNIILKKIDILHQNNFSPHKVVNISASNTEEEKKFFPKNISPLTIVLIFVFVILIGILVFVFIRSNNTSPKTKSLTSVSTQNLTQQIPVAQPPPSEAPQSTSSATTQEQEIKINILNSTGKPNQAENLSKTLNNLGFTDIRTGNIISSNSQKTLVIFLHTLPETTRKKIVDETGKLYTDFVVQESKDSEFDVTIIIGKTPTVTTPTTTLTP